MKGQKVFLIVTIVILCRVLCGDVIIVEPHPTRVCVKVTNADDYPHIALIAYPDCIALSRSNRAYRINSTGCLTVHKSCSLSIYAVKKDYLKDKDIKKINWSKDKNALKSNLTVKANTISLLEPIHTVELHYKIAGFTDTSMVLYKSYQIYKYNYDRQDSTRSFIYEGDISKLKQDL